MPMLQNIKNLPVRDNHQFPLNLESIHKVSEFIVEFKYKEK
jgi:hypothetical protein